MEKKTHFGYREVPQSEKARLVGQVFDSVAERYDLMNDLMSFGVHRLWKRFAVELTGVRRGQRVLDLAGGTGDLAAHLAKRVGPQGQVVISDINANMLGRGRDRLANQGILANARFVQADAEALPFPDRHFDCITMAFGLRNVTRKDKALRSIHRILRPGGLLLVLEFSKPIAPGLAPIYDLYSFALLPALGDLVLRDSNSYSYLAESIRKHPDQEALKGLFETAGFEHVRYYNLTGGIVALHKGYRL